MTASVNVSVDVSVGTSRQTDRSDCAGRFPEFRGGDPAGPVYVGPVSDAGYIAEGPWFGKMRLGRDLRICSRYL